MNKSIFLIIISLSLITIVLTSLTRCNPTTQNTPQEPLVAKHYYSGFPDAHDTYNAISAASDGKIYYVLSFARHEIGGQFYVYDPAINQTKFIANLSEAVG